MCFTGLSTSNGQLLHSCFCLEPMSPRLDPYQLVGQFQQKVECSFFRGGAMDDSLRSSHEDWSG